MDLSAFSLVDKVAIVTGGSRGIGKGIAQAFANVGAKVVIVARTKSELGQAAAEIEGTGHKVLPFVADVCDSSQVARLMDATMADFGRIDIMVNNAGGLTPSSPLVATSEEDWDWMMAANLRSVFLCSKAVARVMIDQNTKGNIVNIASMAARKPTPGLCAYSVSKAGVVSLTITAAAELARYRIRVNAIAPGAIDTGMGKARGSPEERVKRQGIPLGRIGHIDDVAATALYLASDASDFVSGEVIEVKGGPLIRKGDLEMFVEKFPTL